MFNYDFLKILSYITFRIHKSPNTLFYCIFHPVWARALGIGNRSSAGNHSRMNSRVSLVCWRVSLAGHTVLFPSCLGLKLEWVLTSCISILHSFLLFQNSTFSSITYSENLSHMVDFNSSFRPSMYLAWMMLTEFLQDHVNEFCSFDWDCPLSCLLRH